MDSDEKNEPTPWIKVAMIGAVFAMIISGALYYLGIGVLSAVLGVGVVTFLMILYLNPKYYLLRIGSSLVGLGATTSIAPEFTGDLVLSDFGSLRLTMSPYAGLPLLLIGGALIIFHYKHVQSSLVAPKSTEKGITQVQKGGKGSRNLQIVSVEKNTNISQSQDGGDFSVNKQQVRIKE